MATGSMAALGAKLQQLQQSDSEELERLRSEMLAAHRRALEDAQRQTSKQQVAHAKSLSDTSAAGLNSIQSATSSAIKLLEAERAKLGRTASKLIWLPVLISLFLLCLSLGGAWVLASIYISRSEALDQRQEHLQEREKALLLNEQRVREQMFGRNQPRR